jgi:diacylglycerol kinase family enzyme
VSARPKQFDLGRMERPGGAQYFAVACGAGYDARVMAGTLSEHKQRWGMAAYVATTLRLIPDIRSTVHAITIDGVEYEANAAMVLVANCGEVIPPFVRLGPGITPDDGLLDVVVVRANSFSQSVRAVWHLLRVTPSTLGDAGYVGYARGREVRSSRFSSTVSLAGTPPSPRAWSPERSESWCRLPGKPWCNSGE